MQQLHQGGNTSKQVVAELLCLCESIKQMVLLKMKSSPTFNILIDESTDVSVLKQTCMAISLLIVSWSVTL